jgi:exonuclease VII large subunit
VAERIRAYYQNNGIHYEDAQIEEGVRAFFSRRLMFEAPTLNFAQRLLTRLAMAHRKLMIWAACGVMACALGLGINHLVDTAQNTRVGQSADRLARINEQLNQDIAVQRQRLGQVKARLEQQPQPLVAALVAKIDPLLPSASLPFTLDRPDPITRENRAQLQARIQRAQQQLSTPRKQLESARKGSIAWIISTPASISNAICWIV